jgi:hypothetical protein
MSASHVNGIVEEPSSGNGVGPHDPSGHAYAPIEDPAARRPEVAVGAAFLGGFLVALLLRRVRS